MYATVAASASSGISVLIEDVTEKDLVDSAFMERLIPRRHHPHHPSCKLDGSLLVGWPEPPTVVECHEDFRLYLTTRQTGSSIARIVWNGHEQLVTIKFTYSDVGLSMKMLHVIVSHKQPNTCLEGSSLVKQQTANNQRIVDIESEMLELLASDSTDGTTILDDGQAIGKAQTLGEELCTLRDQNIEIGKRTNKLGRTYEPLVPVSRVAQVFFSAISDLVRVETAYAFSLEWFIETVHLFLSSLSGGQQANITDAAARDRSDAMTRSLRDTIYSTVSCSLLSKDKLLFALLLAVRPQLSTGAISSVEWHFLLTGQSDNQVAFASGIHENPAKIHENPAKAWLPDIQWNELCELATLPTFSGLVEEFEAQIKMWKRVHDASEPFRQPLPRHWDADLQGVSRLCILRCLRPDQIANAVRSFIDGQLGADFMRAPIKGIQGIVAESKPLVPIVITVARVYENGAASLVRDLAKRLGRDLIQIPSVVNSTANPHAAYALAQSRGSWIMMQNPHLYPRCTIHFEQAHLARQAAETHADFRSWCIMDVDHALPASILKDAVKVVYEPPEGVRAVVKEMYEMALHQSPDFLSSCSRGNQFRRIFYALCICHAVFIGRAKYSSSQCSAFLCQGTCLEIFIPEYRLGWMREYSFEPNDLLLSSDQVIALLDNQQEGDVTKLFASLQRCVGEHVYMGRVNDEDRHLLMVLLNRFCNPDVLRPGHALSSSGEFRMPLQDGGQHSWLRTIDALPEAATLEFLGLHECANARRNKSETLELLASISLTDGIEMEDGEQAALQCTSRKVGKLLTLIPPSLGQDETRIRRQRDNCFLNSVILQEVCRYDALLVVIRRTLADIQSALEGQTSVRSRDALQSVMCDNIPGAWYPDSYFSVDRLTPYIHDLARRCDFFASWLQKFCAPAYWLGALFSPSALLSALRLNYAREHLVASLADTKLICKFSSLDESQITMSDSTDCAKPGVYIKGIYIQGARWDPRREGLVECLPRSRYAPAPLLWLNATEAIDTSTSPIAFACPLYRMRVQCANKSRNPIMHIHTPSPIPASHWIERSVVMLLQLNEDD
mmetsp:Transcript_3970/g.12355  ORF Transcript_3970/g.12355 Transcript_3970/m.12355 type:complete len:1069 (+) Transcript_3970:10200-13406(+)